jgi:peptidyl-prolyl cis-trans isomerase C
MITFSRKFSLILAPVAVLCLTSMPGVIGTTTPAQAQDDNVLDVVNINGKSSSLNLVGSIINQLPRNIRQQPLEAYYGNVINDVIATRLSAEAARESGLADNPLLKEIAEYAMERVLAEAWLRQEIDGRITDKMINKSYKELVADKESRTEIRARHILVNTEEEALAAIDRLDKGEDFGELAIELSTGPSGPNGGDLGYFRRGAMVPNFEVASFDLKDGTYTKKPVQTQFGWHVIKAEDRRTADAPELDAVRDQLVGILSAQIAGEITTELRKDATITQMSFEDVRAAAEKNQ